MIALAALVAAIFIAHFTRFGRNVYAVGGNARSALLMGLPVRATGVGVYALSGFCSALGGAVFTFYVLSGYGLQGQGMELDAIAADGDRRHLADGRCRLCRSARCSASAFSARSRR